MTIPGSRAHRFLLLALVFWVATTFAQPAGALDPETLSEIDTAATEVLEETGVSSASVAVVHDGELVLTKAYGLARLDPPTSATASMRYPIGSISKQFTAAAVAMLDQEGKLDLDDTIDKYYPHLTRAADITLRQLLSHTSGIRDYWPQDYVPPAMLEPTATEALIERWATEPLDFEPGTKYQYSNTGYVIAGAIVEKVGGKPLMEFLQERIFEPLDMDSVLDIDRETLTADDPVGYQRFALGPLRRAPKEGKGWLFAAGPLAMTAEDLAKWNLSLIESRIPGDDVFRELSRETVLDNGVGCGYGLGLGMALHGERRVVGHGGEVSGFTAANRVYPEDRAAIIVLANQDASPATGAIARKIADLLFREESEEDDEMLALVREVLQDLRKGNIDRSLFTPNANHYFSEVALEDIKGSLKGLRSPKSVRQVRRSLRGGLVTRVYSAHFKKKTLETVVRSTPEGKLEQYTISVEWEG